MSWRSEAEESTDADQEAGSASKLYEPLGDGGVVYGKTGYAQVDLFLNPFPATGLPITEACWANVKVGGLDREVLMQCFERRCLTYTSGNPHGFEVEAGNTGPHYYVWRYVELP